MRRLSLSTKFIAAVIPVLLALGALVALTARDGLDAVDQARLGARLGATWEPLIDTMRVIEDEQTASRNPDRATVTTARSATDQQMVAMNNALGSIDDSGTLVAQLGTTLTALGLARGAIDDPAPADARSVTAAASYDAAEANLVAVGRLLAADAGDTDLARDLTAVAALAEVEQGTGVIAEWLRTNAGVVPGPVEVDRVLRRTDQVTEAVVLFRSLADADRLDGLLNTGVERTLDDTRRSIDALRGPGAAPLPATAVATLDAPLAATAELRDEMALGVVADSDDAATTLERETWIRVGATALVALAAVVLNLLITRPIARRVRAVSRAAREVSSTQLPALVEALHDPRGRAALPEITHIDAHGHDEVAELARSFNALQTTLGDVATQQVEVLRRGVSEIFVTLARRNRSLVDRQLALLDQLEAGVTDPEVLSGYYRLDHLATRMRRTSESLLVLANADTTRRRTRSTGIDDVVRAAIGEVEDYLRVDIEVLEPVKVRGDHVADVAHLLAELLDNATAFSPPEARVRITGGVAERATTDDYSYRITITDDGMGMNKRKLKALNELLANPPVVGLSVEPTLGISVVSLLAAKHGLRVRLSRHDDGIVAEVLLPTSILEPVSPATPTSPTSRAVSPTVTAAVSPTTSPAAAPTTSAAVSPTVTAAVAPTVSAADLVDSREDPPPRRPEIGLDADPAGDPVTSGTSRDEGAHPVATPDATPAATSIRRDPLRLELPADLMTSLVTGGANGDHGESHAPDVPAADVPADAALGFHLPSSPSTTPISSHHNGDERPFAPGFSAPTVGTDSAVDMPPPVAPIVASTVSPSAAPTVLPSAAPTAAPTLPLRRPAAGELDWDIVPPFLPERPSARPVVSPTALPLPTRTRPAADAEAHLAPPETRGHTSTTAGSSPPSALAAALAAFDAGRKGGARPDSPDDPTNDRPHDPTRAPDHSGSPTVGVAGREDRE